MEGDGQSSMKNQTEKNNRGHHQSMYVVDNITIPSEVQVSQQEEPVSFKRIINQSADTVYSGKKEVLGEPFAEKNINFKEFAPPPGHATGYLQSSDKRQINRLKDDMRTFKDSLPDPKEI